MENLLSEIVALCKRRGIIYQSSEIYGGFGGFWDFGPLGVQIKNNIKKFWWKEIVYKDSNIYGLDSSIILNPKVWEASGHTGSGFADPLRECRVCHRRFRADEIKTQVCPECGGALTEEKQFNILVKTYIGPVEDTSAKAYLRGETAQGIFINFKNIIDSFHPKLPFGIAQIGKAFRNEITPGNFIFRSREFEQMELEYFVTPGKDEELHNSLIEARKDWHKKIGLKEENLRLYEHPREKLSHYSKRTVDIEYNFPFGWSELEGIANRGDYDLSTHAKFSGRNLQYRDETGKEYYPYVIEPSIGVDRLLLALLCDSYSIEGDRKILKLKPFIAPVRAAVFPLLANKNELVGKAHLVFDRLNSENIFPVVFDDRGNIGKRYYAQDEIGTPFCITCDFQTLEDDTVTIRDRDTTKQERVSIDNLGEFLRKKIVTE